MFVQNALLWAFFDVPGDIQAEVRTPAPSDVAIAGGEPTTDTLRIPRSLYIAELFRLQDGLILDIEAIMFNMDLGGEVGLGMSRHDSGEQPPSLCRLRLPAISLIDLSQPACFVDALAFR